jgi:hypothetical protein
MRIHEMLAQVTAPFAGMTLSKEQIVALVLEAFPGTNPGSILPGDVDDYDRGEKGAPWKQGNTVLFSRVNRGTFKVLAKNEVIPASSKGRGTRASGKSQEQLIAELRAQLAGKQNGISGVAAEALKLEPKLPATPAVKTQEPKK